MWRWVVAVHEAGAIQPYGVGKTPLHLRPRPPDAVIARRDAMATVEKLEFGAEASLGNDRAASAWSWKPSLRSLADMGNDAGPEPPRYLVGFELRTGQVLAVGHAARLSWAQVLAIQVAATVRIAGGGAVVVIVDVTGEQVRERTAIERCDPPVD